MEMKPTDSGGEQNDGRRGQAFLFGAFIFNVDRALRTVAEVPRQARPVEVAPWASFFGFNVPDEAGVSLFAPRYLDRGYAMTTNLDDPIIIATLQGNEGQSFPLLIDGTHRVYKAHVLGVHKLSAFVLDERESLAVRDDPFVNSPVHWRSHDDSRMPGGGALPDEGSA